MSKFLIRYLKLKILSVCVNCRMILLLLSLFFFIKIIAQQKDQNVNALPVETGKEVSDVQKDTPEIYIIENNYKTKINSKELNIGDSVSNVTKVQNESSPKFSRRSHIKHISDRRTGQVANAHRKEVKTNEKDIIKWLVLFLLIYIAIRVTWYRYKRKCPICGKWNSMKDFKDPKCIGQKPCTITEIRKKRNSKGEVIETSEVDVPATKYYYETCRKCKHCGYEGFVKSYKIKKN